MSRRHELTSYCNYQFTKANLTHNIVRLLVLGILLFDTLNILKVLHYAPEYTWRGLVSTSIFLFIILEIVAYKYYKKKKQGSLHGSVWVMIFFAIFLDFIADVFHLYSRYDWWDQLLHFSNSALACFILFVVISAFWLTSFRFRFMHKLENLHLALFISATSAIALGAIYEVEEYTEDLLYGTHRSGLGTDTANDLSCNFVGVAVTVIVLWVVLSRLRKKSKFIS